MSETKATTYRLPKKVRNLIDILVKKLQISKTGIVSLAIIRLAEKEQVEDEQSTNTD